MKELRAWGEVLAVMLASFLGLLVGGITGWLPASPIMGTVAGLAAATGLLRREGTSWRELGFARAMPLRAFLGYTALTLAVVVVLTSFVVTPLLKASGAPPLDISILRQAIEGNWLNYLVFLLPISWGSAAFGEELLARGFILNRLAQVHGRSVGVVLQAGIFALGHFYQGITGMANIFVLALIFGTVYYRCGRNLWPLIIAHGLIDTAGMTFLFLGRDEWLIGAE